MKSRFQDTLAIGTLFCFYLLISICNPSAAQNSKHILLIGIDGMTTDALQFGILPSIRDIIDRGAVSLSTRAVMPTVSAPNWMSILSGAGPEQHGVTSNHWSRLTASIRPVESDAEGYFPGLFHAIRQQQPTAEIGAIYDWNGIDKLFNHADVAYAELVADDAAVTAKATAYLTTKKPMLLFAYYGNADHVGHEKGFGGVEYMAALTAIDKEVKTLMDALRSAGLYDETTVLMVTDHGATANGHGGESMSEIEVPWIIAGKAVAARGVLHQPNNSMNTAPTILRLLGLRPPDSWCATPYSAPFDASAGSGVYLPKPRCSLADGIYLTSQMLSLESRVSGGEIRFTMDGSMPTKESMLYTGPVRLYNSAVVRAACFTSKGNSQVTTADIAIVQDVKTAFLASPPSEKYPAGGALSLLDGRNASVDIHDAHWLGFEGNDLVLTIQYAQKHPVHSVTISFLRDERSWVFTPDTVILSSSEDGGTFLQQYSIHPVESIGGESARILRMEVAPPTFETDWLRIIVKNKGLCPPGHPGEGKKAWLFVDEIIVK